MRVAGFLLSCGLLVGMAASPALAQSSEEPEFRAPEGSVPSQITEPSSGRPEQTGALPSAAVQLPHATLLAASDPSRFEMAQAAGAPSAPPPATFAGSPWVFGTTIYFWYPWWAGTATIDGLPQIHANGA